MNVTPSPIDNPHITTYTVLMTIKHGAGASPSIDVLELMVERGIEEWFPDCSKMVNALQGDHLAPRISGAAKEARARHKALRASGGQA